MLQQDPASMDPRKLARATERAMFQVREVVELARKLTEDPRKAERVEVHKCLSCFYQARVAGQAFTVRPCMSCGEPQTYSSTATDHLCLACARVHRLCKACGGDINMDAKRRDWPAPLKEVSDSSERF